MPRTRRPDRSRHGNLPPTPAEAGEPANAEEPTLPTEDPVLDVAPPNHLPALALELARQLNRLSFHLKQGWFLPDSGHVTLSRSLAERLVRDVRGLVRLEEKEAISQAVTRHVEEMLAALTDADRVAELLRRQADLLDQDLGMSVEPPTTREAIIAVLVGPLIARIDLLRKELLSRLSERDILYFHLGELIDRGCRPADVHLHLFAERSIRYPGGKTSFWDLDATEIGPLYKMNRRLANCSRSPGEIFPQKGWFEAVALRWRKSSRRPLYRRRSTGSRVVQRVKAQDKSNRGSAWFAA
jgi:hypothetical protein